MGLQFGGQARIGRASWCESECLSAERPMSYGSCAQFLAWRYEGVRRSGPPHTAKNGGGEDNFPIRARGASTVYGKKTSFQCSSECRPLNFQHLSNGQFGPYPAAHRPFTLIHGSQVKRKSNYKSSSQWSLLGRIGEVRSAI
jgi:hypothetical protein